MHDDAHRERVRLGVDEPAATDALGAAQELARGALAAHEPEALVDGLLAQRVQRPDPEPDLVGPEAVVQAAVLREQRERPVAGDDERSLHHVAGPGQAHAADRAVADDDAIGEAAREQGGARGDRPAGQPAVEERTEEREAGERPVGRGAGPHGLPLRARRRLEHQRCGRALAGHGERALGHRALPGSLLPEAGDQLLGGGAPGHHAAEHVLGARVLAALEQEHLGAALREPDRGAGAGRAGADDDGVEAVRRPPAHLSTR